MLQNNIGTLNTRPFSAAQQQGLLLAGGGGVWIGKGRDYGAHLAMIPKCLSIMILRVSSLIEVFMRSLGRKFRNTFQNP